jgi:DMSO/TMAO reductase YedYZ heme-binding membrane subunit
LALLRYLDVVLVVVAAPILLLIGVPAVGYAVGAGAWLALRVAGLGLERYLLGGANPRREISLRLGYLLARVFLLALAVILVRRGEGRNDSLATLGVVVFAFTVALIISYLERPRSR